MTPSQELQYQHDCLTKILMVFMKFTSLKEKTQQFTRFYKTWDGVITSEPKIYVLWLYIDRRRTGLVSQHGSLCVTWWIRFSAEAKRLSSLWWPLWEKPFSVLNLGDHQQRPCKIWIVEVYYKNKFQGNFSLHYFILWKEDGLGGMLKEAYK